MFVNVHFVAGVVWLVLAIAALLWAMACGIAAARMENEGIAFWRGFTVCLLLSPLAAIVAIFVERALRPARRLAEIASRG